MTWEEKTTLVATCGKGCAGALQEELRALGYAPFELSATTVGVEGDMRDAMRMNIWLRTANRVLFEVAGFAVDSPDDLYEAVRTLPWEEWLDADAPFHIHGVAQHDTLRDPRFALLRFKDAVADRFVEQTGRRPDSSPKPEGASCPSLYWKGGEARIYLDTSGESLSHRGYRWRSWVAPLRETLAASILVEAGFGRTPSEAFVGPMCGSGTLSIEAAWMAQQRAPGLHREAYAFQQLNGWEQEAWREMKEEARHRFCAAPKAWISASDVDSRAVAYARENAQRAGVDSLIRFHTCDFRATPLPKPPALVVMNPEYGERMGTEDRLLPLYESIGTYFKTCCQGMRGGVFTGHIPLSRKIGLHPSKRVAMWNGDIECRLLVYDMYEGTRDTRLLRKHAAPAEQ
ncbi:MAG: class I SAM-dependent RNA methyltransferase [Verrucomicrobiota bacterium]|jgi:putative N6-adenine-specific DNA methylase|nr:class I SAM-dependent RNA methyltransferase [Verrucomicrobiota bacterium]